MTQQLIIDALRDRTTEVGAVLLWRLDRRVQGARNCPLGPSFERFGGSEVYAARSHIPMLYERLF
mgnify:CR=1 FL=1